MTLNFQQPSLFPLDDFKPDLEWIDSWRNLDKLEQILLQKTSKNFNEIGPLLEAARERFNKAKKEWIE